MGVQVGQLCGKPGEGMREQQDPGSTGRRWLSAKTHRGTAPSQTPPPCPLASHGTRTGRAVLCPRALGQRHTWDPRASTPASSLRTGRAWQGLTLRLAHGWTRPPSRGRSGLRASVPSGRTMCNPNVPFRPCPS